MMSSVRCPRMQVDSHHRDVTAAGVLFLLLFCSVDPRNIEPSPSTWQFDRSTRTIPHVEPDAFFS
jgi:hypothetical protein